MAKKLKLEAKQYFLDVNIEHEDITNLIPLFQKVKKDHSEKYGDRLVNIIIVNKSFSYEQYEPMLQVNRWETDEEALKRIADEEKAFKEDEKKRLKQEAKDKHNSEIEKQIEELKNKMK